MSQRLPISVPPPPRRVRARSSERALAARRQRIPPVHGTPSIDGTGRAPRGASRRAARRYDPQIVRGTAPHRTAPLRGEETGMRLKRAIAGSVAIVLAVVGPATSAHAAGDHGDDHGAGGEWTQWG